MAGVREAEGDVDAAIDLLDEAERLYVADFLPRVRPVPAVRAMTARRFTFSSVPPPASQPFAARPLRRARACLP